MQYHDQTEEPHDERGFRAPPNYPTPDFYQNYTPAPAPQPATSQPAPWTMNPYPVDGNSLRPVAPPAPPANQAFTGGQQRLILSILSGIASIVVYGILTSSWIFGVGFFLLILIHEFGHIFALRLKRLPATLPIFIPPFGAYVTLPRVALGQKDQADIAIGGPFLGGVGAVFALFLFLASYFYFPNGETFTILAIARFGFLLNLLNLFPTRPLDGGYIGRAIGNWLPIVGVALLGIWYFYGRDTFVLFILILGIFDIMQGRTFAESVRPATGRERGAIATQYFVLVGALTIGYFLCGDFGMSLLLQFGHPLIP